MNLRILFLIALNAFHGTLSVPFTSNNFLGALARNPPTRTFLIQPSQTIRITPSTPSSTPLWSQPTTFFTLEQFGISRVAYGEENLQVFQSGLEPVLWPPLFPFQATIPTFGASTLLRVTYPAGSYNPSALPRGGASFYAKPLDLREAINVTLSYSVYFPVGFQFVKGK